VIVYGKTTRLPDDDAEEWQPFGPALNPETNKNGAPRAMSNLLRPHGIPPHAYREPNPGFTPPHSLRDPMPGRLGSFINTPKGMRRTFPNELAKALGVGVPSAWGEATRITGNLLNSLIGIHIWEASGRCLAPLFVTDTGPHEPPSVAPPPCPEAAATDSIFRSTDGVFKQVGPTGHLKRFTLAP
jgi:hypothetical protein